MLNDEMTRECPSSNDLAKSRWSIDRMVGVACSFASHWPLVIASSITRRSLKGFPS